MCKQSQKYKSSDLQHDLRLPLDKSIGDLFRDHSEQYIKIYNPPLHHIKLIRAIRLCKTPALGGKAIFCKQCNNIQSIYYSCGHSQCPLCQYNKRVRWKEKLCAKMLKVPYTHTVFTIPHQLNSLCKLNKKIMYNIIMRAAWKTIKDLTDKDDNLGALPGMISVLHTFGSDMKYHLHVHSLITFGGVDHNGNWIWPKRKNKLARFRRISNTFRKVFLNMLQIQIRKGNINPTKDLVQTIEIVSNKNWNVKNSPPTVDTQILENYLARYINRIAVSKSRFEYLADQQEVNIIFKDYRNQIKDQHAPLNIKSIEPLLAIHQFLLHVLPPYFQKSRYYGLHASATAKKFKDKIDPKLLKNSDSIKNLFAILKSMLNLKPFKCTICQSLEFEIKPIKRDLNWIFYFITLPNLRAPPNPFQNIRKRTA